MKHLLSKVHAFNEAFKVPQPDSPQLITTERALLRHHLLTEEVDEYFTGHTCDDLANILKELCDIQYILLGTVLEHGLGDVFEDAFNEVHQNNMAKIKGGTLREDGKIQKPDGLKKPDMGKFLNH